MEFRTRRQRRELFLDNRSPYLVPLDVIYGSAIYRLLRGYESGEIGYLQTFRASGADELVRTILYKKSAPNGAEGWFERYPSIPKPRASNYPNVR